MRGGRGIPTSSRQKPLLNVIVDSSRSGISSASKTFSPLRAALSLSEICTRI